MFYQNNATAIHNYKFPSDTVIVNNNPDSKIHGANMGPTWVLSAPGGPHVGPMNLAIRELESAVPVLSLQFDQGRYKLDASYIFIFA